MTIQDALNFFDEYGLIVIFVIVLLEYLNLPGFPAGVVIPAGGVWAKNADASVLLVFVVSIVAGVLGSLILYYIGKVGGEPLLRWIIKKFPKQKRIIDRCNQSILKNGNKVIFISKLIPGIRTIISIPAGVFKMDLRDYVIYSALGTAVWNGILIFAGYFFTDAMIKHLVN